MNEYEGAESYNPIDMPEPKQKFREGGPHANTEHSSPKIKSPAKRTPIQILLTSKASPNNKRLIKFFNENLESLIQKGYIFKWTVVYPEEIGEYKEQNIDKFPTLIPPDYNHDPENQKVGIREIIDYLFPPQPVRCESRQESPKYDFGALMMQEAQNDIGRPEDDIDEEDPNREFSRTQQRMAEQAKLRAETLKRLDKKGKKGGNAATKSSRIPMKQKGGRRDNIAPGNYEEPTIADTLRNNPSHDGDDDMMMNLLAKGGGD